MGNRRSTATGRHVATPVDAVVAFAVATAETIAETAGVAVTAPTTGRVVCHDPR